MTTCADLGVRTDVLAALEGSMVAVRPVSSGPRRGVAERHLTQLGRSALHTVRTLAELGGAGTWAALAQGWTGTLGELEGAVAHLEQRDSELEPLGAADAVAQMTLIAVAQRSLFEPVQRCTSAELAAALGEALGGGLVAAGVELEVDTSDPTLLCLRGRAGLGRLQVMASVRGSSGRVGHTLTDPGSSGRCPQAVARVRGLLEGELDEQMQRWRRWWAVEQWAIHQGSVASDLVDELRAWTRQATAGASR